ncbi:helix-turn-helix transcriptional regulator [Deinococcus marmoris]|uniref:Transcriptional regulator, DeoR family n=1 Tax=Deinococcus marmoris TaxID=249408 RepID=A0A1U7NV50_9DEIO|nr:YafY family protein [Deinococcus marmoris]OLV16777.1 Transcriptional regulator, DeoR family [Deinococcus marmoris]
MNRTDRLFALVLELRSEVWTPAETLAQTFGISVRTVYRDVAALNEAGVPVLSVPGRGYSMMPGYFLPPLHLTSEEAVMLALGADAVYGAFDTDYAQAAQSALKKLRAALPDERRTAVTQLQEHLRIVAPGDVENTDILRILRGAVLGGRIIRFQYHKPTQGPERREVYPLRLVYLHGAWLLGSFDPARGERRSFRLSRMEAVQVQPETFVAEPEWRTDPGPQREQMNLTVRLHFPGELKRAVRERPSFFQTAVEDLKGGLEVTLQVRDLQSVWPWVLSWGADVRVLEPPELRERLREEARRMLLT